MKKLITSLILIILISEILLSNISFAVDVEESTEVTTSDSTQAASTESNTEETTDPLGTTFDSEDDDSIGGMLGETVDGIVGIMLWLPRVMFFIVPAGLLESLLTSVANMDNSVVSSNNSIQGLVTPDDIIFNRIGITNINFFDIDDSRSPIMEIRRNVSTWYYALRTIAIAILLVVLIYIGIKLAISSVASDKAKYSEMLKNWAVSFALVFILHFIIIIIIQLNNSLVSILNDVSNSTSFAGGAVVSQYKGIIQSLTPKMFDPRILKSSAAILIFFAVIGMTFAFLMSYIKRFLTIGFLILISPLITITYSIDKMGDGKSQALNTWIKEFVFNVIIQPFHGIVYLAFAHAAISILASGSSVAGLVFSMLCFKFVWDAEKIFKEIFGFKQASSLGETVASLAAATTIANSIKGGATKAGSAAAGAVSKTSFGKNLSNKVKNTKLGQWATKANKDWDAWNKKMQDPNKSLASNLIGDVSASVKKSSGDYAKAAGKIATAPIRNAGAIAAGGAVWAMATGANDKSAANYGVTAFDTVKSIQSGNKQVVETLDGAKKDMKDAIKDYAENHGLKDHKTNEEQFRKLEQKIKDLSKYDLKGLKNIVDLYGRDLMSKKFTSDQWNNFTAEEKIKKLNEEYSDVSKRDITLMPENTLEDKARKNFAIAVQEYDLAESLQKNKKVIKDQKFDDPDKVFDDWTQDILQGRVD